MDKHHYIYKFLHDEADSSPWYHKVGQVKRVAAKEESVEPTAHGIYIFRGCSQHPWHLYPAFRPIYQVNNKYTWLGANPALSFTIDVHIQKEYKRKIYI